jgi:hypothetical protein
MSRGQGRIQQMIAEMIAGDEHGAWTVAQLCERAYRGVNRVEKKHRVAVTRALRRMRLPPLWSVRCANTVGSEYCLYNAGDEESTLRAFYFGSWLRADTFERWKLEYDHVVKRACDEVHEARRYHEASEIEKLGIDIGRMQQLVGLIALGCTNAAAFAPYMQRIADLTKRKAELERAAAHDHAA